MHGFSSAGLLLDFGLKTKQMRARIWMRFLDFRSDNPKSKTRGERRRTIQNRKWVGIIALAFILTVGGTVARAQQPKNVFRIGVLALGNSTSEAPRIEAIRQGLRELGYIAGQ